MARARNRSNLPKDQQGILRELWEIEEHEDYRIMDVNKDDPGVQGVVDAGLVVVDSEGTGGDMVIRLSADGYGALGPMGVGNPARAGLVRGVVSLALGALGVTGIVMGLREARKAAGSAPATNPEAWFSSRFR